MAKKPFLVVSYSIPNRASGTPVVIRNFLENFECDEVVLMGRPVLKTERVNNIQFQYPIYKIPVPPVGFRGERLWRFLSVIMGVFTGLYAVRVHNIKALLVFYRDQSSLFTGYILHKLTKLPLHAYFCDIYLENYPKGFDNSLAKWLQPRIFKNASRVFVLTEAMKEYFENQYGLRPVVLPHCINDANITTQNFSMASPPLKIGYLGIVNIDRLPSLKVLCEAIGGDDQFEIDYFTPSPTELLKNEGLLVPNSKCRFIPSNEKLMEELSKCDILFLPVMISTKHKERELQGVTGFPTKTLEYLVCQKPILVHSEKHYFVSRFFEEYHCGYCVNGGAGEIRSALLRLQDNSHLRENLSKNTIAALRYFDGKTIANHFRQEISIYEKK
ncbi:glycosyltransferase family protein [Levilinea saccharolytica]|uniref:glycosyltransferase n=1 Tax=Levilinea saccharolytica TaxID=229921 RepID=UPI0011BD7E96|nr:glycosyltransferase [Levilinea saccharolytica]GAP18819.1 glycosyltransferase [Levilinea saccharolytica]